MSSLDNSRGFTILMYSSSLPVVGCHARILQAFKLRCKYLVRSIIGSLPIVLSLILIFERSDNDFQKHERDLRGMLMSPSQGCI